MEKRLLLFLMAALVFWPQSLLAAQAGMECCASMKINPKAHSSHSLAAQPPGSQGPKGSSRPASQAIPADQADRSDHAGHSSQAVPADQTDRSDHAGHSSQALPADQAERSDHAGHSNQAIPADQADRSDHAGHASQPASPSDQPISGDEAAAGTNCGLSQCSGFYQAAALTSITGPEIPAPIHFFAITFEPIMSPAPSLRGLYRPPRLA
jgi:hypothetical protein